MFSRDKLLFLADGLRFLDSMCFQYSVAIFSVTSRIVFTSGWSRRVQAMKRCRAERRSRRCRSSPLTSQC